MVLIYSTLQLLFNQYHWCMQMGKIGQYLKCSLSGMLTKHHYVMWTIQDHSVWLDLLQHYLPTTLTKIKNSSILEFLASSCLVNFKAHLHVHFSRKKEIKDNLFGSSRSLINFISENSGCRFFSRLPIQLSIRMEIFGVESNQQKKKNKIKPANVTNYKKKTRFCFLCKMICAASWVRFQV